jgi:hypothetical protein
MYRGTLGTPRKKFSTFIFVGVYGLQLFVLHLSAQLRFLFKPLLTTR